MISEIPLNVKSIQNTKCSFHVNRVIGSSIDKIMILFEVFKRNKLKFIKILCLDALNKFHFSIRTISLLVLQVSIL